MNTPHHGVVCLGCHTQWFNKNSCCVRCGRSSFRHMKKQKLFLESWELKLANQFRQRIRQLSGF